MLSSEKALGIELNRTPLNREKKVFPEKGVWIFTA
jgi:hypothetical protein